MTDRFAVRHGVLLAVLLTASAVSAQSLPSGNPEGAQAVVSRGGVTVTLGDIDAWVARVPKDQRAKFIDSPARIQEMIGNLLLTKQLAAQARAEHLDQKPEVSYQMAAAQDEVLARAKMMNFMSTLKVPDMTLLVSEEYTTHKDMYKVPASLDVRQILITTEKRSDAEAAALAEKVRALAASKPAEFDKLVEEYSDDASKAENHGLMKDAANPKYLEEFRTAASALTRVGEVSPVIHTTYGYHILELAALHPARQQTFDEVREQLAATLREQYIDSERRDFLNGLNSQKLDINPATLDTLRDRYDEAGNVRLTGTAPASQSSSPPAPAAAKTHR